MTSFCSRGRSGFKSQDLIDVALYDLLFVWLKNILIQVVDSYPVIFRVSDFQLISTGFILLFSYRIQNLVPSLQKSTPDLIVIERRFTVDYNILVYMP